MTGNGESFHQKTNDSRKIGKNFIAVTLNILYAKKRKSIFCLCLKT